MNNLEIGLVVEVNGQIGKIATFQNANQQTFINNGEMIKNVSVNSFVLIQQGYIKIVCRINSETIWDSQNNLKEHILDSRFSKGSIRRVLEVQAIGYLYKGKFNSGSTFLPMVGNVCEIPTEKEVVQIYLNSFESEENGAVIRVGKSLKEGNSISLPVNLFFASHIGVFGNTGSGKSNTLHKLYYELFMQNFPKLKSKSKFLVLDFNGEYTHDNAFGLTKEEKTIYKLTTLTDSEEKYPITSSTFYDIEMLSILFSATNQTQRPFLSRIIKGVNKYGEGMSSVSTWISFLIRKILSSDPNLDLLQSIIELISEIIEKDSPLNLLKKIQVFTEPGGQRYSLRKRRNDWINFSGPWTAEHESGVKINTIENEIKSIEMDSFEEFELRCRLQLINDLLFGNIISDHITPLIKRVGSRVYDMKKYLKIEDEPKNRYFFEIVSLRDLNQEAKQIMGMLIAKMYFKNHKSQKDIESFHLIIDEAHNILSYQAVTEKEAWRDYRLATFEEIIKEGRKFGFFLTLSSQRPADISPTILSQVHNFFLHKLVNERDLQIIENSISTLDRISKSMLPILGQGVCVISGTALSLPIIVEIDFLNDESIRPQSDTINLIEKWL